MVKNLRDIIVAGPRDWIKVGDRVEGRLPEWTQWYGGSVVKRRRFDCPETGRDLYKFDVRFDDGETGRRLELMFIRREEIEIDELEAFLAQEDGAADNTPSSKDDKGKGSPGSPGSPS